MGARMLTLLIIVSVLLVAFVSFKKLADYLIASTNLNYLPALLFAFSPFLFNEITGGSWYMWVSYAFSPLYFLYLIKFVEKRNLKDFIFLSLASLFVVASIQNFISLEIIAVLYLILQTLVKPNLSRLRIYNFLLSHLGLIVVHFFWILPFLYQARSYFEVVTSAAFTGNFSGVKDNTQSIQNIFSLTGYLNRNMYFFAIPDSFKNLFYIAVATIWVLIITALYKSKRTANYFNFMIWMSIFLMLILLIKGGNAPFSAFTMIIFEKLPGMSIYRSPQHLMFFASFIIPLLVCFSLHYFARISKKKAFVTYFFLIIFWLVAWWFNGELGSTILRLAHKDHIDSYSLNPDMENVYNLNESSSLDHRMLFLPTVYSPFFLNNNYQNEAQGGQPEYYMKNPTFSSEYNQLANLIDEKFCLNRSYDIVKLFSITNVRFLAVRNDIAPAHTSCASIWSKDKVEKSMVADDRFQIVSKGEFVTLFRLKDNYFLPIIYTATETKVLDDSIEKIDGYLGSQSLPFDPRSVFLNQQQNLLRNKITDDVSDYQLGRDAIVEYKKVNPVSYQVVIHRAKGKILLVLGENYDKDWKLYPTSGQKSSNLSVAQTSNSNNTEGAMVADDLNNFISSGLISQTGSEFISKNFQNTIQNDNLKATSLTSTLFKQPLDIESRHLITNGYSNGWVVDAGEQCGKLDVCTKNDDGSYDLELSLQYWPQRVFYLGVAVSSSFLAVLLLIYLLVINKGHKR
jgi:hypothetical protein